MKSYLQQPFQSAASRAISKTLFAQSLQPRSLQLRFSAFPNQSSPNCDSKQFSTSSTAMLAASEPVIPMTKHTDLRQEPQIDSKDPNRLNPFVKLIPDQQIEIFPEFELEAGETLTNVPVAYKTWGKLNERGDNVMVICHALTGSADVGDWWGPLLGEGRAFDPSVFFIVCINALGSPYGTASPCTINPATNEVYGPEFPLTTVKDDARLQRQLLDKLGVKQIAFVVGGSMGGMLALEFAFFGSNYARNIILLATCAYHSAWGISWGEAQRQSIYSDPKYMDGYYDPKDPPSAGLGAARMSALLTYRSRNSFDSKFGRNKPDPLKHKGSDAPNDEQDSSRGKDHWSVHNHGNTRAKSPIAYKPRAETQHYFTAQSYLRYQAQKFVGRFDANCYIAITRKLDTHDVSRNRGDDVEQALKQISQPVLVVGISSDGLFTFSEQEKIAEFCPQAQLHEIISPDGHDAFLLEFEQINRLMLDFLDTTEPALSAGIHRAPIGETVNSMFGEADVTTW